MKTVAERAAQLQNRVQVLQSRLYGIEHELESHQSRDWEELATEREGDEVLEGLGQAGLREIAQIEAALARVEAGTFGECVRCGDLIVEERLDLIPHTPFCAPCAQQTAGARKESSDGRNESGPARS